MRLDPRRTARDLGGPLTALMLSACLGGGPARGPVPSQAAQADAAALGAPRGWERTTIRSWTDPRPLGTILRALAERTAAAFIDSSHNVPLIDRAHDVRASPDVVRYVPTGDLAAEAAQSPYHYGALAAMTRAEDGDLNLALSVAFAEMIADGSLRSIL